jgi:RNA 2',3'-cyclic 3'-phosphodiesterase
MRAFVGVPLAPLEEVGSLLAELDACGADLKVVDPKNLHVTLKFLGDIPDAQSALIVERLKATDFPTQFPLGLRGVGAFPDWKKLNIVWIGLTDPTGSLARCFALNERVFGELGFPPEDRAFTAHITIARKRSDKGKELAKEILSKRRDHDFGQVVTPGPRLYKSTLTPQGPIYESLGGPA